MPVNKNFLKRIEILDELLCYRRWEPEALYKALDEKLQECGISIGRSTFFEAIKHLEIEYKAPIHRPLRGDNRYYYTEKFSIKEVPLDDGEVMYLRDALDILKQVSNFNILSDIEAIVQKLENKIHTSSKESSSIIQFEQGGISVGNEFLDNLFTAVKNKSTLKLFYQPFNYPEPKEITVHPYLLKEFRNRWFLLGRTESEMKVSVFALDRIKKIKNSSQSFIENDLFSPDSYFNNLIGVSIPQNSIAEEIIIKVDKQQAPYIITKPIHKFQEIIRENKDGSIVIRVKLIINYELKSLLLSYGPGIEVKSPQILKEDIKALLQKTLSAYQ